jgi:hypothetical protein
MAGPLCFNFSAILKFLQGMPAKNHIIKIAAFQQRRQKPGISISALYKFL